MKELIVTMRVRLPESALEVERKIFTGNATVTWRALMEDMLHEVFHIPLTETHKFIGDYSITEGEV